MRSNGLLALELRSGRRRTDDQATPPRSANVPGRHECDLHVEHSGLGRRDDEERGVEPSEVPGVGRRGSTRSSSSTHKATTARRRSRAPPARRWSSSCGTVATRRRSNGASRICRSGTISSSTSTQTRSSLSRSSTRSRDLQRSGFDRAGYFVGYDYVFLGRQLRHGLRVYKLVLFDRHRAHYASSSTTSTSITCGRSSCTTSRRSTDLSGLYVDG